MGSLFLVEKTVEFVTELGLGTTFIMLAELDFEVGTKIESDGIKKLGPRLFGSVAYDFLLKENLCSGDAIKIGWRGGPISRNGGGINRMGPLSKSSRFARTIIGHKGGKVGRNVLLLWMRQELLPILRTRVPLYMMIMVNRCLLCWFWGHLLWDGSCALFTCIVQVHSLFNAAASLSPLFSSFFSRVLMTFIYCFSWFSSAAFYYGVCCPWFAAWSPLKPTTIAGHRSRLSCFTAL
ncbi:unnamed protein product [Ilex paraguariensis]|uniref:Uncharacterized protein n=1 Tax=Ilex paraguariensis TaxID=185542 RepID=A0ABC8RN36_9AQUA